MSATNASGAVVQQPCSNARGVAKVTLSSAVGREIVEAADLLLALEETDFMSTTRL
jgi:hypothetical protein